MARQRKKIQQLLVPEREGFHAIFDGSYLTDIPAQILEWKCTRILLVVSKTLDSTTQYISDLEAQLGSLIISKKAGVGAHSPYVDVIDIAHRIQSENIDAVISIGSGSYSDACKVARLMAATLPSGFSGEDMETLIDDFGNANMKDGVKPPAAKLIVVPTSLSAGEWNSISSASNPSGKKQHFGHPSGAPDLILLDPEIANTSPESLWLASGVRAIDHCVETICNPTCKPECAEIMEHGLRCLLKGLPAYKESKSKGEREELLAGISECQYGARDAMCGYLLYKVTFGPSHAIGHQLGSVGGVVHGVTSCICLAPVLRYTHDRNPDAQKQVLNIFNEVMTWNEDSAGDAVERFVNLVGLPTRLTEVGVTKEEDIESIAEKTLTDALAAFPGQLKTKREVLDVLNMVR
jgi:alcohol dehydrogenase class IV